MLLQFWIFWVGGVLKNNGVNKLVFIIIKFLIKAVQFSLYVYFNMWCWCRVMNDNTRMKKYTDKASHITQIMSFLKKNFLLFFSPIFSYHVTTSKVVNTVETSQKCSKAAKSFHYQCILMLICVFIVTMHSVINLWMTCRVLYNAVQKVYTIEEKFLVPQNKIPFMEWNSYMDFKGSL